MHLINCIQQILARQVTQLRLYGHSEVEATSIISHRTALGAGWLR